MKNVPSKDELIGYLKTGKKTVAITVGLFIIFFVLILAYSLYSTFTELREEDEVYLSQEEIVEIFDREPEEVSALDIRNIEEALEQERYAFGILIEREDQTFYNYPALMTEFLISEEVVSHVEQIVGKEILPSPELVVEVSEDSSTRIQEVVIGTADEEDNILIAEAYYAAIQEEGLIPPLSDKVLYMMDDKPFLVELETWLDLALAQIQFFSPIRALVGFVVMGILGFIVGMVVVLIKTFFKKEIPFMYELKEAESDKVLYFNQIRDLNESEKFETIIHAMLTFPNLKKIILTQNKLNDMLEMKLEEKLNDGNRDTILLSTDVNEIPLNEKFDEVIILVEQNKTTKLWYKNQRIQLERLNLPVTIVNH